MKQSGKSLKRAFDFGSSLLGLIILSPLFIGTAIAIKKDSKGPVFFKQERLGKDGEVFGIYKFRTMIDDAENTGSGIKTFTNDPRITKTGQKLRKTSIDELPQLINVFKGDMSIVGPRPPVPYHPNKYEDYPVKQKKRFRVQPGITGYAQIKGRNNLSWDERIQYDVQYVRKQTILFDLYIILQTAIKVLKKEDIHSTKAK